MPPHLELKELLDYTELETRRWKDFFQAHPATLDVALDIAQASDARTLVLHILGVDWIYAGLLEDQPPSDFEKLPHATVEELFAIGGDAHARLRKFLDTATEADWQAGVVFPTRRLGTLKASKRKAFVHTLLHGVRHWAQLSTALRAAGFKQDWQHDFLFTAAME